MDKEPHDNIYDANGGEGRNTDYGVVVGVNIPLGGGVGKDVRRALNVQVAADQLAFERTYASVCANLDSEDYSVTNRAATLTMLKNCRTEIVKRNTPAPIPVPPITPPVLTPPPVVNSELEQLRKDNAELRLLIAQLAEKLDKQSVVPGGY